MLIVALWTYGTVCIQEGEFMSEQVRLVVWDLDETFWRGTLREGGITYNDVTHDIVIELARRGILSSICSKNDPVEVASILSEHGIWDYFIFPSVNWDPKGPRIGSLIETVQLRPENVLMIDDNPANLNEAIFFVKGIQVSDEGIIPRLLSDPRFNGREDGALTRLKQYKLLEQRRKDQNNAACSNLEFLRSSRIRVSVDHEIEEHLDRAVELINRTNQLNFTKRRLSEDQSVARAELSEQLSRFDVVAGLIRVQDNYGDYGFCGFFLTQVFEGAKASLIHYVFSCRILGMGVETFVYQNLLERPALAINGDVLADPIAAAAVDWIEFEKAVEAKSILKPESVTNPQTITLRGGCDLAAIEHYARMAFANVKSEYSITRHGLSLRRDHSLIARHSIEPLPVAAARAMYAIGYEPCDFQSPLFADPSPGVWAFSCLPDSWEPVYRHNETGALIPFCFESNASLANACNISDEERRSFSDKPYLLKALEAISSEFCYVGLIPEESFKHNLITILGAIPKDSLVFLILNKEYYGCHDLPERAAKAVINVNQWTREVARSFHNVYPMMTTDFVHDAAEIHDNHFHRMVYFRMFSQIEKAAADRVACLDNEGANP